MSENEEFWLEDRELALSSLLQTGAECAKVDDFEAALRAYDRALDLQPDCPAVWHHRAQVLTQLKQFEAALVSVDRALELQPEWVEAWVLRGQILQRVKRPNAAIAAFNHALTLDPTCAQAWVGQGDLARTNPHKALESYSKAIDCNPAETEAWRKRAAQLWALHRHKEALGCYDYLLDQAEHAEDWQSRGNVLYKLKRYDESVESYDRAFKLMPENAQVLANRGIALQKLGLVDDAIASFDQALKLQPQDPNLWHRRGLALRQSRQFEGAIASFDQALLLQSDFCAATQSKLFALVKLKRLKSYVFSKAPIEKMKRSRDLQNLVNALVKTKLPACIVIGLSVFLSVSYFGAVNSRLVAIAVALAFLIISLFGDWLDEAKR